MPERKVDFLDCLAFAAANKDQRKQMNAAYLSKKAKRAAKEIGGGGEPAGDADKEGDDSKSSKSGKSSGKASSKSARSAKSAKSQSSSSMSAPDAGSKPTDAGKQRSERPSMRSRSYSEDDFSRERRSASLLLEAKRPSTAQGVASRTGHAKPKKSSTRSALKTFGRKLFGMSSKPKEGKNGSLRVPGKWVDSTEASTGPSRRSSRSRSSSHRRGRSSRPRTPHPIIYEELEEEEEEEVYVDPNFDPARIDRWLDGVDDESLAPSGVALSDQTGLQGRSEGGYHMDNFPMRSDRVTDCGRDFRTVVPGDSVTQAGGRRHRRKC